MDTINKNNFIHFEAKAQARDFCTVFEGTGTSTQIKN